MITVQELKGLIDARHPNLVIVTAQSNLEYLFALYLAGWPLEKLHNHDSSWIGWSKDDRLPMEAGLPREDTSPLAGR